MDFNREIQAFIDWIETNPLGPTTQTLWMHLMVLANKSGNPDWFTASNPLLQAKVGVSENTLSTHRNHLIQKGRIEYKSQGKNKSGKYRIIPLTSNIAVNHEVRPAVNHEVRPAVKGSALINNSSSSSSGHESFFAAHKRVFGFDCNQFQADQLGAYIDQDGMDEAVVVRAIERAGTKATGYNFRLISKILDDYFRSGALTISAAVALDDEYDKRSKSGKKSRKVISYADLAKGAEE